MKPRFIGVLIAIAAVACHAEPAPPPSPGTSIEELRVAVAANPDDASLRRRLAIALHETRQLDEALTQFEMAAKLLPDVPHLLELAIALASVSRLDESQVYYEKILTSEPRHAVALHNLANLHFRRGQLDLAISRYHQAIAARPDYVLARFHLGQALERSGKTEEAYRTYESIVAGDPRESRDAMVLVDALYRIASIDLTMGATERAVVMLAEVVATVPEHPQAHYAYGQALLRLGQTAAADKEFETHRRLLDQQRSDSPAAMDD